MAKQPKSLNKILATSAGAAVVAGALAPAAVSAAAADDFTDVSEDTRHYEAIDALYSQGIINGFGDGTFGPDEYLKRSEAVEMIFAAGNFEEDDTVDYEFTDVPTRIAAMVDALAEAGVISGFSETQFGPNAMLQREEMAKILVEAFDYEVEGAEESDFTDRGQTTLYPYIDVVAEEGIANGYENGEFGVGDKILRKDFAAMLYRAMDKNPGQNPTLESVGTAKQLLPGVSSVRVPLSALEGATVDSTVTLDVDGEVVELTYDAEADAFQNLQVSGFEVEELLAGLVMVEGEEPIEDPEWTELDTVADYEGNVTMLLPGVYGVKVDLSSESDVTADSMVGLKVGDDEVVELDATDDAGVYQATQVSGYTEEELKAATVVVQN